MNKITPLPKILTDKSQLGLYPMEKLKPVDKPTTGMLFYRLRGFVRTYREIKKLDG